MNPNDQPLYSEGTQLVEKMVKVNEQVSLRIFSFTPAKEAGKIPFVLIGGLATLIDSLGSILYELSSDFTVHYIETRDKASAQISGHVQYDIETMGIDIAFIIKILGLEKDNYAIMGYSMGATIVADCYRFLDSKPRYIFLLEPTPVFHYPSWSLFLIRWLGIPFSGGLKRFAKWYLSRYIINKKEDNEMAVISSRTLDEADPKKLASTILDIAGYKSWDKLDSIRKPTLIIGTSKDQLHEAEDIARMVSGIANCSYIDLETNKRSHSAELVQIIRSYIKQDDMLNSKQISQSDL